MTIKFDARLRCRVYADDRKNFLVLVLKKKEFFALRPLDLKRLPSVRRPSYGER